MGLHVLSIEFDKIKPRVRIEPNALTKKLEKQARRLHISKATMACILPNIK